LLLDTIKKNCIYFLITICVLLTYTEMLSQTIMGYNGLFRIPTATVNRDGEIKFVLAHIDKRISVLENGINSNLRTSISLNYFSFLEINLILNKLVNSDSPEQANGDRQSSFKILLADLGFFPNVAIGAYDALGSLEKGGVHSDFIYLTTSKIISISNNFEIEASVGYAESLYHQENTGLKGAFGGLSFRLFDNIEIFGEYDSKYYNSGARLHLLNHLILFGGFNQMKYFSGGGGICFQL